MPGILFTGFLGLITQIYYWTIKCSSCHTHVTINYWLYFEKIIIYNFDIVFATWLISSPYPKYFTPVRWCTVSHRIMKPTGHTFLRGFLPLLHYVPFWRKKEILRPFSGPTLFWMKDILGDFIRGATKDGTTCCRTHKLHVFPYFITNCDVLQHKLHSIIAIGVVLQIIYFTVAVIL